MSSTPRSLIAEDLARVALRVESHNRLGTDFCDRLTRSLAQLFGLAEAQCSEEERDCFDQIFVRITPEATPDARLFLSDQLSGSSTPPRGILLVLANDLVEIARPILENSPALTDDDLVEIARNRGVAHMEAIAERRELSIRVTDVLVLRGDDVVRQVISGNGGAQLSDKSFARLSLQARKDDVVESRLVGRDDLPAVVIHFLIENGSPSLRDTLRARARAADHQRLGGGATSIRRTEEGWLEPYDFTGAASVMTRFAEVKPHLDGFLRKLAETDHFPEMVHILSAAASIRLDTMKHVMVSLDTEPFLVIARALGLSLETVREVLSVGPWMHRLDGRARAAALDTFRQIETGPSRERLRRWQDENQAA